MWHCQERKAIKSSRFSYPFVLIFLNHSMTISIRLIMVLPAHFKGLYHTKTHWFQKCHVSKVDGFQITTNHLLSPKAQLVSQILSILKRISTSPTPSILWKKSALQELSDITPVHTHSRYFGATVLMKFVATSLTSKSI